jgi:hypothetical protein
LNPDTYTLRAETPEDWQQLLALCVGDSEPERIVYLWNLDLEIDGEALFGTDALLHLAQALEKARPAAKLRIDAITRGAQAVGREQTPTCGRTRPRYRLAASPAQ